MDRSFFEQPGKRILLDKCSFFELLHQRVFSSFFTRKVFSSYITRKEDVRLGRCWLLNIWKAFWRSTTGFSQSNRFAQKSSFLNFWCTFSLSHRLNVFIFSFLSTSIKLKQILWDYLIMETLPLVKYCKPNFQISANFSNSPLSKLHHPDMHALIHQKDFLPLPSFLSFFLCLLLYSQLSAWFFCLFCAFLFLMFFFSLF